jgi:hypothetical protein
MKSEIDNKVIPFSKLRWYYSCLLHKDHNASFPSKFELTANHYNLPLHCSQVSAITLYPDAAILLANPPYLYAQYPFFPAGNDPTSKKSCLC